MWSIWLLLCVRAASSGVWATSAESTNSCSSPKVQLISTYSTTDSAILTAHATSVHLSIVCENAEGSQTTPRYYSGPVFFRLDDEVELKPLAVIEPERLQASWKTAGTLAPAASFTIRLYGEQAAAQFRKGAPATELGRLSVDRPAATRDAWLAGEAVALASAFVLAALAITSRAGIAS